MITLYSMPSSGNSYKVRLLLHKLGIPFRHVAAEYGSGVTTSDDFRKLNPNGKVPLVVLEDGRTLAESDAILTFFGEGTRYMPQDRYQRAKMFEWMFFEQNYHEGTIAVRAAIRNYSHRAHQNTPEQLQSLLESGNRVLGVMDAQLVKTPYMAGDAFTLADIALYAYTHSADTRGGFDLSLFPNIQAWLKRCEQDPGHVPIEWGCA